MDTIIGSLGFASFLFLIFLFVGVPLLAFGGWILIKGSKLLEKMFK